MLNNITGFHIEPTNICTLKCPRCARTEFLNTFGTKNWTNAQLNLEHFKNFFDIDLTNKRFNLCGNDGDPIYYNDLIEMVTWLKSRKALVKITTNGSYKTNSWWSELCEQLTSSDRITFSIDGLPENFTEYRINADWESIERAIDITTKSCVTTAWKYIPFSFNEHNIEQARSLSRELGFDEFNITPSDRWSNNDPYRPKNFTGARETSIIQWHNKTSLDIDPKCKNTGYEHFITADGFYTPCCYSADYRWYYQSEFYKQRNQYDISKNTITQILNKSKDFFDNVEMANLKYCEYNCPKI